MEMSIVFTPTNPVIDRIETFWQESRGEVLAAAGSRFARTVDQLVADARRLVTRFSTAPDPHSRLFYHAGELLTAASILEAEELPGHESRLNAAQRVNQLSSLFLQLREVLPPKEAR